ncbi:asparaginase domain-containing protein [Paenibacillus sp. GCM10012307]|uniref:Asparaginase n=1 Tax=Paenibacillus roseus TaxID=2798579 RepID=A0A934MJT9_9BACL|nr:asparaginase domain-containing protein [Paenibacillus roseus]MBJ6360280.1 asparaginase [Paenibacillus roseus]
MKWIHTKWNRRLYASLLIATLLSVMIWGAAGPAAVVAAEGEPSVQLPVFPIPPLKDEFKQSPLPNVLVIGTGGTLAGKAADATSFQNYRAGTYEIERLVGELPGKDKIADVATYQFGNKGSGGYTFGELYDLSLAVDQALETYDGVVVTTGTDTMEEIGYFLDLTVRSPKPVVITGAMRPWDVIGTDAPANLYNAIKLAGSGKTKWFGTVLMLNDVIHSVREVTKSNAHRMDTFETKMVGALGYIDEKNIRIYRLNGRAMKAGKSNWQTPFDLRKITKEQLPLVEIAYVYQDAGGGAIRGLVADGAQGIVTAGTGAGGLSAKMSAARNEAIRDKDIMFVTTTRTGSGTMYPGGNNSNILAGDSLNAQHARVMLMLAMAFTKDKAVMKDWFATFGTQDIDMNNEIAVGWELGAKLEVADVGQTKLTLKWPAASSGGQVKVYRIYQEGNASPVLIVPGNARSAEITGLKADTAYSFTVKAVDLAGSESSGLTASARTTAHPFYPGGGAPVTSGKSEYTIEAGSGKKLSIGDELIVEVPAGAIDQEVKLTIEKLSGASVANVMTDAQKLLSAVFEITKNVEPEFSKPLKLTFTFDSAALKQKEKAAVFYYDESKKAWIELGGQVEGAVITAETSRLGKFAVLAVAETPSGTGQPEEPEQPTVVFSDTAGHWAASKIAEAVKLGITKGYPDGAFKPEQTVTRAEFAVLLMNALKSDGAGGELNFADSGQIGAWAREAVAQAVKAGVINGYNDHTFRPDERITRAEMVAMIAKALKLPVDGNAATGFADDKDIPAWAKGAVNAVKDQALVQGRGGNRFAPQGTATRAEAVTVIMNMLEKK